MTEQKQTTRTSVISTLKIEGIHSFPKVAEVFPEGANEVDFLEHPHRHIFTIRAEKEVTHDNRDMEFIYFKHRIREHLESFYHDDAYKCLYFGAMSCEMIARVVLEKFDCISVEVWEDDENGARIVKID